MQGPPEGLAPPGAEQAQELYKRQEGRCARCLRSFADLQHSTGGKGVDIVFSHLTLVCGTCARMAGP